MSGPAFTININHQEAQRGASALGSIENLLKSIDQRLAGIRNTAGSVTQVLNVQKNTFVQQNTAITQVNQSLSQTSNVINQVENRTRAWERSLSRANTTAGRLLSSFARLNARAGSLVASGSALVGRRASQSFGGLGNGGGVAGLAGDIVKAPFAVAEFGVRLGGDLAQGVLGSFGKVLAGAGGLAAGGIGALGAVGGPIGAGVGAVVSGGLSIAGGATGIGGAILGALGQSAGAVLGAVGELGGRAAESLTRGLSRGLTVGAGLSIYSIFKAAEFEDLERGFGTLLKGTEDEAEALRRLEEAAGGTVSKIGLLKSANLALSLGVAKTSDEIATLIEGSRLLGRQLGLNPEKAFDRLTVGLARGSVKVLDDLGLNPNRERAYRDFAASIGVAVTELSDLEKQAAFSAAAMKQLEERVAAAKMSGDGLAQGSQSLSDIIDSLKAGASDLAVEWGQALTPAAREVGAELKGLLSDGTAWLSLHKSEIAKETVAFIKGIPGFYRDATAAAKEYTVAFAKAIGFSDETIKSGAEVFSGAGTVGARLSAFGANFIADLPAVLETLQNGVRDVLTSDTVTSAAKYIGSAIGEAAIEALLAPVKGGAKWFENIFRPGSDRDAASAIEQTVIVRKEPRFLVPGNSQAAPPRESIRDAVIKMEQDHYLADATSRLAAREAAREQAAKSAGGRSGPSIGGPIDPRGIAGALPSPEEILGISKSQFSGAVGVSRSDVSGSLIQAGYNPDAAGFADEILKRVRGAALGGRDISNVDNLDRTVKKTAEEFVEELKASARATKDDVREKEASIRSLEHIRERQEEAVSRYVDQLDDVTAAHFEQADAIRTKAAEELKSIRDRANQSLGALPNEIANRFAGEIDQSGISTHARHAYAREERLRRRETARDINKSFGSRGFEDAFGGRGFGGFGTGTPAEDGAFGGLSGSTTSTEATAALLEAVKTSAALADEAAKIRNKYMADTAAVELEAAKSRADVDSEFLRTVAEINASIKGRQANDKRVAEVLAAHQKELAALKATDQLIANQIRSVK